jgi:hypothetical protein
MLLTAAGRRGNFPAASGSMTGPVYITVRRDPPDFSFSRATQVS